MKKFLLSSFVFVLSLNASDLSSLHLDGKYQQCYDNSHEILKSDGLNMEANLYLGMCSYGLGKYKESIEVLEKLLIIDENHQRARLELARAYMALKMYEVAKVELEVVLESNPPMEVEKNVKDFLVFIDNQAKEHSYSLMLSLMSGYDTNINTSATKEDLEALYPGTVSAGEIEAYFISETFGLNHTFKPRNSDNFIWLNSFVLVNQNNFGDGSSSNESEYDYIYTKFSTSPSYIDKNVKLSPNFFISYLNYGGSSLLNTIGLKPDVTYVVDKNIKLNFATGYYKKSYFDGSDFGKELNHYDVSIGASYEKQMHAFYVRLMRVWEKKSESSAESFVDRDGWSANIGYNISYGVWNGGIGASYTNYNYDDIISGTTSQRDDAVKAIYGSINRAINDNFDIGLSLSYQKNSTNYTPSEYKKFTAGILLSYKTRGLF